MLIIVSGELPVQMMHHCLARHIGFKGKSFSAKPISIHIVSVSLLYFLYQGIHLCVYIWPRLAVTWEKVN